MSYQAGKQRSFGSKPVTQEMRRARAINLIGFCTVERFAVLTAEDVAAHSGLPLPKCAEMLARAKRERGQ